jgi:solute carrier family 25 (adenine nucleotide translocator) protein 4/5/6/31
MAVKEKPKLNFFENFALSGVAAVVSKTAAAPIERVKLLVQNQGEMIKQGTLAQPYKGVIDCTVKTFRNELTGCAPGICGHPRGDYIWH